LHTDIGVIPNSQLVPIEEAYEEKTRLSRYLGGRAIPISGIHNSVEHPGYGIAQNFYSDLRLHLTVRYFW
jgi:hypothetical protein